MTPGYGRLKSPEEVELGEKKKGAGVGTESACQA